MASLRKLTNGKWQAQVAVKGTRKSASFERKADAVAWASDLEREIKNTNAKGFVYATSTPVKVVLKRYESEQGSTWSKSKTASIGRLLKDMTLMLDELTPVRVREYALGRKYGLGTTRIDLASLAGCLRYCRDVWFMEVNIEGVAAAIKSLEKSGAMPRVEAKERIVSPNEELLIEQHWQSNRIPPWIVGALIDTPVRSGELVGLRRSDINGRIATIRGRKDPRNPNRIDRVPLLGRTYEVLQHTWGDTPFPYPQGKLNEAVTAAVAAAGLEGITAHTLRHTGITRMLESGYSIPQVALVSGHRNWNTMKRYTHLTPESLLEVTT